MAFGLTRTIVVNSFWCVDGVQYNVGMYSNTICIGTTCVLSNNLRISQAQRLIDHCLVTAMETPTIGLDVMAQHVSVYRDCLRRGANVETFMHGGTTHTFHMQAGSHITEDMMIARRPGDFNISKMVLCAENLRRSYVTGCSSLTPRRVAAPLYYDEHEKNVKVELSGGTVIDAYKELKAMVEADPVPPQMRRCARASRAS